MTVKSLEELTEVLLGVVWARRSLGMVLHGENRGFPVPDAFDGAIIEVKVGHLKCFRARNAPGIAADREAVVLGGDKHLPCRKIADGVVSPAVTVREFDRVPPEC